MYTYQDVKKAADTMGISKSGAQIAQKDADRLNDTINLKGLDSKSIVTTSLKLRLFNN